METPASAEPVLTDEIIDTMKVKDLRDALSKRGVNKAGLTGELIQKLKESVAPGSNISPALLLITSAGQFSIMGTPVATDSFSF